MNEDTEAQSGIKPIMVLNRDQFYAAMRDVIYDEKPQTKAFVNIIDVFDFVYDLGLEDTIHFAFEEDVVSSPDVSEDDDSSSLEDSDVE